VTLPRGWAHAILSDVTESRVEQGEPGRTPVKYIDIGSIDRALKRIDAPSMVTTHTAPTRARQWVRKGDVLVSMTRPNLNAVAMVPEDLEGAVASTGFDVLRAVGVLPEWIFYRVRTDEFIRDVCQDVQGVVYPAIRPADVRGHRLPVAPIAEQRRIVEAIESHLSRIDAAVATLERAQAKLKAYRASVLKAAVEGRLVPTEAELARVENREYEPADVLLNRILAERRRQWEESELAKLTAAGKLPNDDRWKANYEDPIPPSVSGFPNLPKGWCWATVDQLTNGSRRLGYGVLVPGPDVPGGVPLIRVGDLEGGTVKNADLKQISRSIADQFRKTYLRGGEVLISLVGTIGRTAVVPPHLAGANVARAIGVIPTSDLVSARWVEIWFRSPLVRALMDGKAHEVARKTLNLEDVRRAVVALPPRAEQERITTHVEDLDSIGVATNTALLGDLKRCARLRQSLLAWAFTGMLVEQDSNDEPAVQLLDRIREERSAATPSRKPRVKRKAAATT